MKNIVVIAPHTDDETLGAGGYLLKHRDAGDNLYWINVTNAKTEYGYSEEDVLRWNTILENVSKRIGFKKVFDLGLEPAGLWKISESEIIGKIKSVFDEIEPNIVILPYYGDAHSDHKSVFDAAMSCCKIFRCSSIEMILCMEIISETDYANPDNGFVPNYYVDITDYIDEKIDILKIYDSEISAPPFPRSIDSVVGMAKFRGAACFSKYAEGYRMIKAVEK